MIRFETFVMVLLIVPMLHAQDLAPELAAPAAKHKAAVEALEKQRQAACSKAAASYVRTLNAVEKAATSKGILDLIAAVVKEREAAVAGRLEPEMPAALAKARVNMTRKALLARVSRINADFSKRRKPIDVEYFRVLNSLQAKALPDSELAKQLAAEKAALLAGTNEGAGGESGEQEQAKKVSRGKNVVVNGDFEKLGADGKPEGWNYTEWVSVEAEKGNTFVRFEENTINSDGTIPGHYMRQEIAIVQGVKRVFATARIRTHNCVANKDRKPGVTVVFKNIHGKSFSWVHLRWNGKNGSWTTIQNEGSIPDGSVNVVIEVINGNCLGQIDFDDVEVTFK